MQQNQIVTSLLSYKDLSLKADFFFPDSSYKFGQGMNVSKNHFVYRYNRNNSVYFVGYSWELELIIFKKTNEIPYYFLNQVDKNINHYQLLAIDYWQALQLMLESIIHDAIITARVWTSCHWPQIIDKEPRCWTLERSRQVPRQFCSGDLYPGCNNIAALPVSVISVTPFDLAPISVFLSWRWPLLMRTRPLFVRNTTPTRPTPTWPAPVSYDESGSSLSADDNIMDPALSPA